MELRPDQAREGLVEREEKFWLAWQDHIEELLTSKPTYNMPSITPEQAELIGRSVTGRIPIPNEQLSDDVLIFLFQQYVVTNGEIFKVKEHVARANLFFANGFTISKGLKYEVYHDSRIERDEVLEQLKKEHKALKSLEDFEEYFWKIWALRVRNAMMSIATMHLRDEKREEIIRLAETRKPIVLDRETAGILVWNDFFSLNANDTLHYGARMNKLDPYDYADEFKKRVLIEA